MDGQGSAVMIANPIDRLSRESGLVTWIRAGVAVAAFRIFLVKSNFGGRGRMLPSGGVPGAGALVIHDAGPVVMLAGIVLLVHVAIGFERALRGA
jgi:hypothetical protein